jgi:hypothetical protein
MALRGAYDGREREGRRPSQGACLGSGEAVENSENTRITVNIERKFVTYAYENVFIR